MSRSTAILLVLGAILAAAGAFFVTWEVCTREVLGQCVAREAIYQAPGLALLVVGILAFAAGLTLLATRGRG